MALLDDGTVLSCGRNDYGQLGHGHTTQRVFGLKRIEDLVGKGVTSIACGCYHSLAVSTGAEVGGVMHGGGLYVFGRNNHGQLGTGDDIERHSPCMVPQFANRRVLSIAAGFYHTIIVAENENVSDWSAVGLPELPERGRGISRTESDVWNSQEKMIEQSDDGISAADAATFLAGHLDNMVQSADVVFPASVNDTFSIDPSTDTFSALLALLAMCDRGTPESDVSWCTELDSSRLQTLLTTLRLLHANLAEYLKRNQENENSRNTTKTSKMCEKLGEDRCATTSNRKNKKNSTDNSGSSSSSSATNNDVDDDEVSKRETTFSSIKRCLLRILEHPSHFASPSNHAKGLVKHLQSTAARVLIVGLQLFYPTSNDILSLFMTLVEGTSGPLTRFLLHPLLSRLSEDDLILTLFPKNGVTRSSELPAAALVSVAVNFLVSSSNHELVEGSGGGRSN
jgi:hypothetical protein